MLRSTTFTSDCVLYEDGVRSKLSFDSHNHSIKSKYKLFISRRMDMHVRNPPLEMYKREILRRMTPLPLMLSIKANLSLIRTLRKGRPVSLIIMKNKREDVYVKRM